MSSEKIKHFKPFCSVLMIVLTLFSVVFLQMEERRLGYSILKLNRESKKVQQEKRQKEISLMRVTRPQLVETVAHQKLTLKRIQPQQIIHLTTAAELLPQKKITQTFFDRITQRDL